MIAIIQEGVTFYRHCLHILIRLITQVNRSVYITHNTDSGPIMEKSDSVARRFILYEREPTGRPTAGCIIGMHFDRGIFMIKLKKNRITQSVTQWS